MRIGFIYNVIYKSRCLYVGSTWNFKKRLIKHKDACYNPNSRNYNCNIYKFIRVTDVWEAFRFTIIDTIETDNSDEDGGLYELQTAEQFYIDMLEPTLNVDDAVQDKEKRRKRQDESSRNSRQKNRETKRFVCEPCGFNGGSEKDLDRHYISNKHKKNSN